MVDEPSATRFCAVLSCTLVLGLWGCEKTPEKSPEKSPKTAPATNTATLEASAKDNRHLDATASHIITQITELEARKDVTCWTSFRQLDNFIATKQYSDHATLAKIATGKHILRAVWAVASQDGEPVTAEKIDAVLKIDDAHLSDGLDREGLTELAGEIGMRDYKDYRKTSEHWRVILSVVQDAIVLGERDLAPLTPEGAERLADLTTKLSLATLRESGQIATTAHAPFIEANHVEEAYEVINKRYGIDKILAKLPKESPARSAPDATEIVNRISPLTRQLIDAKVKALVEFNKEPELLAALNKVSRMPIEPDALKVMLAALKSFNFFVSRGFEPMRSDNFLSDGSFAQGRVARKVYLDPTWTENTIMQIFPHVMMPNGDIALRFEPNPGTITETPREPFDLLMLDYEQNGVRDSAVHWLVMRQVFEDHPFAMDPFAAEYLSEVTSMMMTMYIRRAEELAKKSGKGTISADLVKQVRDPGYVMVLPHQEKERQWTDAQEASKKALLAKYDRPLFEDATKSAGLPVKVERLSGDLTTSGVRSDIQRVMGSGVAVGDVNRDGFPDLFIAGEGLGRLFINRGVAEPGAFDDRTKAYGLPEAMHDSRGALFFDRDGDGDLDLFVARSGHASALFSLDGDSFTDITTRSKLATRRGAHVPHLFDYDGDGDLDLFIGYYGSLAVNSGASKARNLPSIDGRNSSPAELWRMEKDGTYTEVASSVGVADTGWTLAASSFDYDRDGDQDLYLANDFGANSFYRNKGDGTFEDASLETRTADRGSGMNVSFSDIDQDGWIDFFVTNIDMFSKSIKIVFPKDGALIPLKDDVLRSFQYITGNKLYLNRAGDGDRTRHFVASESEMFEPGDQGWAWDGNFIDVDLDGDEDLYIANGWIEGSYASAQKNILFLRDGDMFYRMPDDGAASFADNSRAVASLDVDRDGDLDLIVTNFRGAPRLLKNVSDFGREPIQIILTGEGKNTRAVGARVVIETPSGKQTRVVTAGRGYLSQDDPDRIIVGLGEHASAKVSVYWPGGKKSERSIDAGELARIAQSD